MDARAHLYVCGDVTMASDVCRALMSVLMRYQAFSESEAEGFITDMKVRMKNPSDVNRLDVYKCLCRFKYL